MKLIHFISILFTGAFLFVACSKDSPDPDPEPPGDPCAGKTITVSASSTAVVACGCDNRGLRRGLGD